MKKECIISILMIFLLSFTVNAAPSTSVSVKDVSGSNGSVVEVPISVAGASGIGSLDIVLTYNSSVLNVYEVKKGELTRDSLLNSNSETPGIIAIGIADSNGLSRDGTIAIIAFKVAGKPGDTSQLSLDSANANEINDLIDVPISRTSSAFTVVEAGMAWKTIIILFMALFIIVVIIVVKKRYVKI